MRGVGKFDANLAPRCQPALIPNIHKHYNEKFDEILQTKTKIQSFMQSPFVYEQRAGLIHV